MEDERRTILSRVAIGDITPEEGAGLLEEINHAAPTAATGTEPAVRRIRIARSFGQVEVTGDPTVREAVAEGPHVARREGDTLCIESDDAGDEAGGFTFAQQRVRIRIGGVNISNQLRVRVNPDLPLEVESQAGTLRIRGVHSSIKAKAQAGSTQIEDFRGPLDLSVQAGSVRAEGVLDHGDSHIRCEAGKVRLHLLKGSSVRITARASLGKVTVDGENGGSTWTIGSGMREAVIGDGAATLAVEASMGNVRVSSDR